MTVPSERGVVCITGGTGFIGSHFVAALGSSPGTHLRLLSRHGHRLEGRATPAGDTAEPSAVPVRLTTTATDGPSGLVTEVCGSLLDEEAVRRFATPGAVLVNLAHASGAQPAVNVAMASNLAKACLEAPVAHLVHCSTAVVAGRPDIDTVVESVPCRPVTEYQAVKLEIERLLRERLEGHCPVTILRPTAVFGRGGRNLCKPIDELIERSWLFNVLKATLLADRRLHLVCVENVVAAIRFVLGGGSDLAGETFIVSDDDVAENNYRDVLDIVADELGRRRLPAWQLPFQQVVAERALRLARHVDPNPRRVYSSRKLRQRGFTPPLELCEGVRRFVRWYATTGQRPR